MRNTRNIEPTSGGRYKTVLGGCLLLVIIIIGGAFALNSWYQNAIFGEASSSNEQINLVVEEGENFFTAAAKLQEQGALKSIDALRIYLRLNPTADPQVKAGSYLVPKNLNVPQLLELIAKGPVTKVVRITIVEGLRMDEIADDIAEAYTKSNETFNKTIYLDIAQNPDKYTFEGEVNDFLKKYKPTGKNLEGFLFPDTYNVAVDAAPQDIIDLQLRTLINRIEENDLNIDSFTRLDSFYEILNLASIVQREARVYTDMQMISDIFLRRLEERWFLNADAALLYPLKRWSPGLTQAEIAKDSAYNTYKRLGLPPTPICNPGIEAISAILEFEPNQYYYYITDKNGVKRYGRTLQEHNNNIANYGLAL